MATLVEENLRRSDETTSSLQILRVFGSLIAKATKEGDRWFRNGSCLLSLWMISWDCTVSVTCFWREELSFIGLAVDVSEVD